MAKIADAWNGERFLEDHRPMAGRCDHRAKIRKRESCRYPGSLVNILACSGLGGDLFDNLHHEIRDLHRILATQIGTSLLQENLDPLLAILRVVGLNQRADPVFELRDDLAAAVVGARVGREKNEDVQIEVTGYPRICTSRSSRMLNNPT